MSGEKPSPEQMDRIQKEAISRKQEIDDIVESGRVETAQQASDTLDALDIVFADKDTREKMKQRSLRRVQKHAAEHWDEITRVRAEKDFDTLTLFEHLEQKAERQQKDHEPWPGDICLLLPDEGDNETRPRLVFVRYCEEGASNTASVALISSDIEMAGGTDVVLESEQTGLPYNVMVETDVIYPVFWNQLSQPFGSCEQEVIDGVIETEFAGIPKVPHARRGMPLKGPADPRWDFKLEEAQVIAQFGGKALGYLIDKSDNDLSDNDADFLEQLGDESEEQLSTNDSNQ